MHKTLHSQRKEKCVNYRLNIAEVIVQNVQLPNYKKRGKSALGETTLPQVQYWAHLPKQIDLTPQKKKKNQQECVKFTINTKYEAKQRGNARCKIVLYRFTSTKIFSEIPYHAGLFLEL